MNGDHRHQIQALGLCSGGLDSMLAALVLRSQGIDVRWITFETPFFSATKARAAAAKTGIELIVRNITPVYLEMLKNPPCGYGKHMNPCMDCHALMFRLAGQVMTEMGYDFLFSGEVMGQRPMSQTLSSLRYVEKHSGYDGYIVRPLSAKLLAESIPEKENWVDRSRLLDISGRSRKSQMALAKEFGINDFPAPAGGCLLTDKGFSVRLRDLFAHQAETPESDLHLLKYGRHLRLNPQTKLIVGRTQKENELILKYVDPARNTLLKVKKIPGPTALISGSGNGQTVSLAAAICAGYSKASNLSPVEVQVINKRGRQILKVLPILPADVKQFLL
jgi:tRNA-uridine 2-sulfurtransferase